MANTDYMNNPEFKDWLKSIGFDIKALQDQIDNDDYGRLDDLVRRFEEKKLQDEKNPQSKPSSKEQNAQDNSDDYLKFSQGSNGGKPGNELDAYYKEWCEKEHQPPYVYENTNEASPAYGMKYYKTQEDKAAGKPAARVLYHDSKNVQVEGADGKAPDYEILDALVRKAALDGQPGIKFDEEMSPEFANKLAAACLKYGMKMKGQPEKIDVSEFAMALTPEQKANIDKYNSGQNPTMDQYSQKVAIAKDYATHGVKEADVSKYKDTAEQAIWAAANREAGITPKGGKSFYSMADDKIKTLPDAAKTQLKTYNKENVEKLYKVAKKMAEAYKQANPGKDFDLSQSQYQDPKSAALVYAAYTEVGVKVTGMDKVNKDSDGMFRTETQGYMPDKAKEIVANYNYGIRQQQVSNIERDQRDTYSVARTSSDDRDKLFVEQYQERQRTLEARQRIRDAKKNGQEADKADKDLIQNRGNVLEEFRKRQQGGR